MRGLELHQAEGLDDVVVRAALKAGDPVHFGGAGGEHDDRNFRRLPPAAQAAQHFQSVHTGQHDVQQIDHRRGEALLRGEEVLSRLISPDLIPGGLKIIAEHFADTAVILDNDNGVGHGGSSFFTRAWEAYR